MKISILVLKQLANAVRIAFGMLDFYGLDLVLLDLLYFFENLS